MSSPANIPEQLQRLQAERDQALHELEEARRELAENRRLGELGQLAAGIAHELRQPLGVIGALVYLLRTSPGLGGGEGPGSPAQLVRQIDAELALAGRIISNLLDYVRRRQPVRNPVNLNRLVERQAARLRLPPGIRMETGLAPALPHVFVDALHIERAVYNLLENAVDAMRAGGGLLTLATYLADGAVVLEIRDTGEGIPEQIGGKIFEPLFSTREKGAGLGLALTRQLLEANGSRISFTSAPGRGTCFRLQFKPTD